MHERCFAPVYVCSMLTLCSPFTCMHTHAEYELMNCHLPGWHGCRMYNASPGCNHPNSMLTGRVQATWADTCQIKTHAGFMPQYDSC